MKALSVEMGAVESNSKFLVKLSIDISQTIHSFSKLFRWPRNKGFKF